MPEDLRNVRLYYIPVKPVSELHSAAQHAATLGLHVFPIAPDSKTPPFVKAWQEAATIDPAQIDDWWQQWPNASIGWAPARSGHVIVDLDCKPGRPNGRASLREIETRQGEQLPTTWTISTPSNGEHRIFAGALPNSAGRIGPAIDIRGGEWVDGELLSAGYGLLPPSTVDGKPYSWAATPPLAALPPWFAALGAGVKVEARQASADEKLDLPYSIEEAKRWLRKQPAAVPGSASDTFYRYACKLKDMAISPKKTLELLHAKNPDYEQGDIQNRIANAEEHGQNERGSDRPIPPSEKYAAVEIPEPEPPGEPVDLFGNIGTSPTLTRDMLPNAPAIEYAFDVAARQGVDPVITVTAMLATCAAAITDQVKIIRKASDDEHQERAHFNGLIAEGVGGGKTPAIKAMTKPLKGVQMRLGEEHSRQMVSHKNALTAYSVQMRMFKDRVASSTGNATVMAGDAPAEPQKPIMRHLVINDATIEGVRDALLHNPHGLLNEQDEVTGFIASWDAYRHDGSHGKDRAFWLQTDGGGTFFVNRAIKADGSGGGVTVPNLSCCFIGGIQTNKLRDLAASLTDDGFIQRSFVFTAGAKREEQDRPANQAAQRAYVELIERLVALGPTRPIRLSAEAHHWRREVEQRADDLANWPVTPSAMIGRLNKWKGKFARLLLLFHVMHCVSRGEPIECDVSGDIAERARDYMLDFVLPHQLRFYTEFFDKADAIKSDARWIAGYILAHKLSQITLRDIQRARHLDPETDGGRTYSAMRTLENAAWLGVAEIDTSKRSTRWPVNPQVHERFAQRAAEEKSQRTEAMRQLAERGARLKAEGKTRKFSQPFVEPKTW